MFPKWLTLPVLIFTPFRVGERFQIFQYLKNKKQYRSLKKFLADRMKKAIGQMKLNMENNKEDANMCAKFSLLIVTKKK
jgi:hypothetical protein